ncbi:hypothetical protein AAG570_006605 [Ranatra chinensis]|uniref:Proteasome inhibitor PI31 subunit n=1 Tax=Ranatra chinensis TaxID=642074 RepID=A0ABD0YUH5_9HEMI
MSELFGWDLIYRVTEPDINKKEDVLLLLVHFQLIKNGYRCIGLGDEKTLTGNETSGETLPQGWNRTNSYALRYVADNQLFILRGITSDDSIVFNLLQVPSLAVSSVAFNYADTVASLKGSIGELVPSYDGVLRRVKKELLEPVEVSSSASKEATTQTKESQAAGLRRQSQPGRVQPSPLPTSPLLVQPPHHRPMPAGIDPIWDPLRVGQSDLDPLGRGGGMIFNPFQPHGHGIPDPGLGVPGGLPRGAVPPGARFDPFGPPGFPDRPQARRPPPDSDHMPPPGFDGMFM